MPTFSTPDDIVSKLVFRDGAGVDCTARAAPITAVLRWVNPCEHDAALPVAEGCWFETL